MKVFVVSDWISEIPGWIFEYPQVYGITIRLPYANFIGAGEKYGTAFMGKLIDNIRSITNRGKKIAIGVAFGKFFPTMPGIRYVILHDWHHQGTSGGYPVAVMQPVFWEKLFVDEVLSFFTWFRDKLKGSDIYDSIEQIKITGANEKTEELKPSDQDWRTASDTSETAYRQAAEVWKSAGYSTVKVKMAIAGFIDMFHNLFPDKIIALPVIGGLAGFPCINIDGICLPKEREDIAKHLIEYGVQMYDNFAAESTALTDTGGTPSKVADSGAKEIIYQVRRQLYNPTGPFPASQTDQDTFQQVIENGKQHNGTVVEIFKNTLLAYPNFYI